MRRQLLLFYAKVLIFVVANVDVKCRHKLIMFNKCLPKILKVYKVTRSSVFIFVFVFL